MTEVTTSSPHFKNSFGILLLVAAIFVTCKKKEPDNPYTTIPPVVVVDNPDADDLPEGGFAWLHEKIFRPTCANSGCHDGTFEPEFRSIWSSYNSLVNHPVIANDAGFSFTYRVVPGDANASFLHERLVVEIPNTSGIMPAVETPDWTANSALYIQKITDWINSGAKDMYGNPPPAAGADFPPLIYGVALFPHNNTTTPYLREEGSGTGPFLVDAALVDVWILPYDQETAPEDLSGYLKLSESPSDFTDITATENYAWAGPITATDFGNSPNNFYFMATIDLTTLSSGDIRFLRSYIDDGVQTTATEIPNNGSNYFWYLLFSLKVL